MKRIEFLEETVVQNICDQSWGINKCPNQATFLIKHIKSPMYAIMCEPHKDAFFTFGKEDNFEVHSYSQELNEKYAREADEANAKK